MKKVLDRYQPKISEILLIEDIISNINENNLQQSIETIKTSKFLQSQDNLKVIMKRVGRIIKYRKQHIKCFFALIDSIFSVINSYFNKKEVMLFFSSKLIFLKLLHDNYISIEDIVSFYGIGNERILYFYPEVKNFLLHNSHFNENILLFTKYRSIIDYFSKHEEKIDFIDDPRLKIGNVDKLSVFIQKDDIDSFQQKISLSNIDTQTYKIKLTNFEVKKFLDKEIFLIEYAALHGSLKIFKFLLMNDSKFSNKLFQYAIFGRNNEIIHLSEKMLEAPIKNIYECLRLTVISHQNELSQYLIENFECQSFYRLLPLSIYYNNYSFFFNHFLEFDKEYNEILDMKEKKENDYKKMGKLLRVKKELVITSAGNFCLILLQIISNIRDFHPDEPICREIFMRGKPRSVEIADPLFYSILMFNNENAKFLLSYDSINVHNSLFGGVTPFLLACYLGNIELVQFLCKNDKKQLLKQIFKSNENALLLSTRMGNYEVVKYLVSLNTLELTQKNINGETAIETAARLGYKEIFNFLKSKFNEKGIETCNELEINTNKCYPTHYNDPWLLQNKFYQNIKVSEEFQLLF